MRSSVFFSAVFAASAAAAPMAGPDVHVVDVVIDVTHTVTAGTPAATVHVQAAPAAPKVTSSPKPAPVVAKLPVTTTKADTGNGFLEIPKTSATVHLHAPTATAKAGAAPDNSETEMLATYNHFRSLYGLSSLKWSAKLAANAAMVGQDGHGVDQIHKLDAGEAEGQIITPGTNVASSEMEGYTPFGIAMLAWLCEVSTDSEVSSLCPIAQKVTPMDYVETGHHDIIVDPSYKEVGCAFAQNPSAASDSPYQGLWVCTCDKSSTY